MRWYVFFNQYTGVCGGMHQQVPLIVLGEDTGLAMQQVPANELKVFHFRGCFDWQGEVATALGCAIITENFIWLQF